MCSLLPRHIFQQMFPTWPSSPRSCLSLFLTHICVHLFHCTFPSLPFKSVTEVEIAVWKQWYLTNMSWEIKDSYREAIGRYRFPYWVARKDQENQSYREEIWHKTHTSKVPQHDKVHTLKVQIKHSVTTSYPHYCDVTAVPRNAWSVSLLSSQPTMRHFHHDSNFLFMFLKEVLRTQMIRWTVTEQRCHSDLSGRRTAWSITREQTSS